MKKALNNFQSVGLDTNIFVYYFNRESSFYPQTEQLFRDIATLNLPIFTSVITLAELLSFKAPQLMIDNLEQELLLVPKLTMVEVTHQVAKESARIRRDYKFRLSDAIQLATAKLNKTQVFISNDARLKQFKEIKVMLIDEVN